MIRYDRTQRSVIAVCACGWRDLALSLAGAERLARDHLEHAHRAESETRRARSLAIRAAAQRARYRERDTPSDS